MTVVINLPNSSPQPAFSGMAVKILADVLPEATPENINTFCYCLFECEYVEKVFGDLVSSDFWKNDRNTLIFRRVIASDTVTIKLLKDNTVIATIVDNTFGIFTNGFVNGTPEQQLYVAFTVEWEKVLTIHGGGIYKFETDLNILGVTTTVETHKYNLFPYSDQGANQTVRIEWIQNGNILRSQFDFTGLNFSQSLRIRGRFTETTPQKEEDRYSNVDRKIKQITAKTSPQYLLKTHRINRSIYLSLTRDFVLANELLITDYNIINEDIFRRISVVNDSIEKPDIGKTTRPILELTFSEKADDILKRNN